MLLVQLSRVAEFQMGLYRPPYSSERFSKTIILRDVIDTGHNA